MVRSWITNAIRFGIDLQRESPGCFVLSDEGMNEIARWLDEHPDGTFEEWRNRGA